MRRILFVHPPQHTHLYGRGFTDVLDPSLLLYGCNAAYGDAGEEFVTKLHNLTNANIAAAAHPVGNPQKSSSWQLGQQ
ncbi:MAG: DUF4347 domain-containing protein [Cyanobacteria bacterium P01_D01_bin.44]